MNPGFLRALMIVALIALGGCAAPSPSPLPTTAPPTATSVSVSPTETLSLTSTPVPTDTLVPLELSIQSPQGDPVTLDGILSPGEWDGARIEEFAGNELQLLLQHDGVYLYLGIRPGALSGSICIDRGDRVTVLYSSASLATAIYKKSDQGWVRARNFEETRDYASHLEKEGWLASAHEAIEFQIVMPKEGAIRLAAVHVGPPFYSSAVVWPANLADDCQKTELVQGNAPRDLQFSPETWMTVTAFTATAALPIATPDTKQVLLVIYEKFEEREYGENDPEAIRIAQEAAAEGKVLAAICVAPITLARAGVLEGKRATTSLPSSAIETEGAIYTGATVERDGFVITASGPAASDQFGETIVAVLEE